MNSSRCVCVVAVGLLLSTAVAAASPPAAPASPLSSQPQWRASDWIQLLNAWEIWGMGCDADNNLYVVCGGWGTDLFLPPAHLAPREPVLAKFAPSGQILWSKLLPHDHSGEPGPFSLQVDASGSLFLYGDTDGLLMDPAATLIPSEDPPAGEWAQPDDCILARMDSSGRVIWQRDMPYRPRGCCDYRNDAFVYISPVYDYPTRSDSSVRVTVLDGSGRLRWTAVLAGQYSESSGGVCIDEEGGVIVYGRTDSEDFQLLTPFDSTLGPPWNNGIRLNHDDLFVTKFDAAGRMCWSSYLGGSDEEDVAYAYIFSEYPSQMWRFLLTRGAVDGTDFYIIGVTESTDFPLAGAFDSTFEGVSEVFIAKITGDGRLAWSTFCDPPQHPNARSPFSIGDYFYKFDDLFSPACILPDGRGNIYVYGTTCSPYLPVLGGFDSVLNESGEYHDNHACVEDAAVLVFGSGGALRWSTYLGGRGQECVDGFNWNDYWHPCDWVSTAALLPDGGIAVAGWTASDDFPLRAPLQETWGETGAGSLIDANNFPLYDGFLSAFSAEGDLCWSTYVGGLRTDVVTAVVVDSAGALYAAGYTLSPEWPVPHSYGSCFIMKAIPRPTGNLVILTSRLRNGYVGAAYSDRLAATGDAPPFIWSIADGSLPEGLSLDAVSGAITGTPTHEGSSAFTVRVDDSHDPGRYLTAPLGILITADDEPPRVSDVSAPATIRERIDKSLVLTACGDDRGVGNSPIVAAEYSVDTPAAAGTGIPMAAVDGAFDSLTEQASATIDTSSWRVPVGHELFVRVRDEPGNWSDVISATVYAVDVISPGAVDDLTIDFSYLHEVCATGDWLLTGLADASLQSTIIDIGSQKSVVGVSLAPEAVLTYFPRTFSIWASPDGQNWTCVARQADWRPAKTSSLWQCEPVTARYVKLEVVPLLNKRAETYEIAVSEVKVYSTDISNPVTLRWTATDEDASGDAIPASVYDLRTGFDWLQLPSFDSLDPQVTAVPRAAGHPEEVTYDLGWRFGRLWGALKSCDACDNWSDLSSSAGTYILPYGFQPNLPTEGFEVNSTCASQFSFFRGPGLKNVRLAFSDRPDFPSRAIRQGDLTSRTIRFPLRFADIFWWKPTASRWKTMLRLGANSGRLYWRMEGKDSSSATIIGPTRSVAVPVP